MNSEASLNKLKVILNEIDDLTAIRGLLMWDQETYMPPGGSLGRSYQLSALSKIIHLKATSPENGQLLEDLKPYAASLDPDSDDARLIKVAVRHYERRTKMPVEWVAEFARVTGEAYKVWEKARAESDFASFQPFLKRIVELRREYASFFIPYDHVYDPLLDEFEPGMKTADVQEIFAWLRPRQVDLIKEIGGRPQVDDSFLHQPFPEKAQWEFGVDVITRFGYDWNRGRQDKTAHPFTQSMGLGDVRITTRFLPEYLPSALFSTTHEAGHALYEMGVDPKLDRTPLGIGASMAIHESQSRLYENLVSRSFDFWVFYYPRLQEYFPSQLGNVPLEKFYAGINQVAPSLIRVEADEATYNLHIMLRLELEIALMEGKLEVADLQQAWNDGMRDYLGLTPPNDAQGVLQDVHWSSGYIGYFPTYALGNLICAQLWEVVNQEIPDLPEQIRRGEFSALTAWMKEKIHCHGAKFEPQELVQNITGSKIDPAPYLRYLTKKYSQLYGL